MFYIAPAYAVGSLYCNTILANLNARAYLGGGETTNIVDVDLFTVTSFENTKTDKQPVNTTSGETTLVISQQVCFTIQPVIAVVCLSDSSRQVGTLWSSSWNKASHVDVKENLDFIYGYCSIVCDSDVHGTLIQTQPTRTCGPIYFEGETCSPQAGFRNI